MTKNYFKKTALGFLLFFIAFPVHALTPDDTNFFEQWYLEQISVEEAWDTETGSGDVIVAILDTGVDLDHPDLKANIWTNDDEILGDGIDNDNNGFVDDYNGYDFIGDSNIPQPDSRKAFDQPAISHGTAIAGIIGAVGNNGIGISGINWKTKLMSVRILDNLGVGNSGVARKGIEYAVANGANIISMSFTGMDNDPALGDALEKAYEAGVVVVAAVGNSENGIDVDDNPIYPACYGEEAEFDWVLGVAATNKLDGRADFSNYGTICTDISAPGVNIFSTTFQDDNWPAFKNAFYISGWSGTSLAVPMVAGAAALLKSNHSSLSPKDIKNILRLSVDPIHETGAAQGQMGAGRLNIAKALALSHQFADVAVEEFNRSGELVKLKCGKTPSADDICHAVYFHSSDNKRHAFPNDKVFFTWFDNFDSVKEINQETMSTYQLGKNVTYRPGVKMVKFVTSDSVYAVDQKGLLRMIDSEQLAAALYGDTWNKQIDDISDVFFGNYKIGEKILTAQDYDSEAVAKSSENLNINF